MMTIRDVMTSRPLTVRPETPLKEVARLLVENGFTGVPVVDAVGRVLGIVSEADFLIKEQGPDAVHHRRLARLLGESEATRRQMAKVAARTAGEAMTAPAVTIEPGRPVQAAAAAMTDRGVKRLPVVEDGRLVGIVTRSDLVRAFLRTDDELLRTIREDVLHRVLWLDPLAFELTVRNGEVAIGGRVERRSTARTVEEAVGMVPGVVSVTSTLTWSLDDRDLQPASRDVVFPYGIE